MATEPLEIGDKRPQRDGGGRFLPGHAGGPGRPRGGGVRELRRALLVCITQETIGRLVAALLERAEAGDAKAAALLLSYAVGKPEGGADLLALERREEYEEKERAFDDWRDAAAQLEKMGAFDED